MSFLIRHGNIRKVAFSITNSPIGTGIQELVNYRPVFTTTSCKTAKKNRSKHGLNDLSNGTKTIIDGLGQHSMHCRCARRIMGGWHATGPNFNDRRRFACLRSNSDSKKGMRTLYHWVVTPPFCWRLSFMIIGSFVASLKGADRKHAKMHSP